LIITFDPAKSAKDERERGLPFAVVAEIDFATAQTIEDTRRAYPERRFVLTGYLGEVLVVSCYTPIAGACGSSACAAPTPGRGDAMPKKPPALTDAAGEVRELTRADLRASVPFYEAHPELALAGRVPPRRRGAQKAPTKERITIRLSRAVVEYYRRTGPGWQARLDETLLRALRRRQPPHNA
jgi:uncharacterized protein (DUF4415 family)/uncharacterized DUF497 family protein